MNFNMGCIDKGAFNIATHQVGVTVAKVINISRGVFSPSKGKLFSLTAAQVSTQGGGGRLWMSE